MGRFRIIIEMTTTNLVCSFVGLTPGILVSVAVFRWFSGTFGSRRGYQTEKSQGEVVRLLR